MLFWSAVFELKINGEEENLFLVLIFELLILNLIDGIDLIFEFKELLIGNLKGEEEKVWLLFKVELVVEIVFGLVLGFGVW